MPGLMDFMLFAPAKPAFQSRFCNGCGQCCLATRCDTARDLFGVSEAICPALEWDAAGSLYRCRLVRTDFAEVLDGIEAIARQVMRAALLLGLGDVGRGCGCPDDVHFDLVDLVERGLR